MVGGESFHGVMVFFVLKIGFSGQTVKSVYYLEEEVGGAYCKIVFLVEDANSYL